MIHVNLFNISLLRSVSESLIHLTKSQLITGKFFCPLYITSDQAYNTANSHREHAWENSWACVAVVSVTAGRIVAGVEFVASSLQRLTEALSGAGCIYSFDVKYLVFLPNTAVGEITTVHRVFSLIALQFTLWTSIGTHFITDVTLQSSNICRELVVKNVSSVLVTNTTWKLRVEYFIHISFIIFTIYLKSKLFRIQTKKDYIFESFLIQSKSWLFDRKHNESRIIAFFTFIDRMLLCQYKMFPQVNTIIHQ